MNNLTLHAGDVVIATSALQLSDAQAQKITQEFADAGLRLLLVRTPLDIIATVPSNKPACVEKAVAHYRYTAHNGNLVEHRLDDCDCQEG